MKKKICACTNIILLIWFLLAMVGMKIGNQVLVSRAIKDDWIFFVIYLVVLIWFLMNEKLGKYVLNIWLLMWFATQFMFHWYYTIWGAGQGKAAYFADTIKLINLSDRYIPDLYHIILHALILLNVSLLTLYIRGQKRRKHQ